MRQLVDQAATVAREARQAEQEALESEKKAEKGTARLEKRRNGAENDGRLGGERKNFRGSFFPAVSVRE
jgi:hypothetical protein